MEWIVGHRILAYSVEVTPHDKPRLVPVSPSVDPEEEP